MGDFVFYVLRIRRKMVEKNLAHTFPDKSLSEIRRIARKVYQNQAMNIIEMLRIPLIENKVHARELVEIRIDDHLRQRIVQQKGAVLFSGHLGSWELIGFCTAMLLGPLNSIVKPIKNKPLDKY
ncbi:MAG: lysophospholipid acyltransferase family protein, partial [Desulfonatronovibrio sp.]